MSSGEATSKGVACKGNIVKTTEGYAILPSGGECSEFGEVYVGLVMRRITSHGQFIGVVSLIETQCILAKLNGGQFRQIYSSFSYSGIHSQTQRQKTSRTHSHPTEQIVTPVSLFISTVRWNHL